MGALGNLFDVLADSSYREIEEEAAREVVIALAGNSGEVRDKLHRALSTRLESLWTSSPFRLLEPNERPNVQADETESGLLLYALYKEDRISADNRRWLLELAQSSSGVAIILVMLSRQAEEPFNVSRSVANSLRTINPLRLVGGKEATPGGNAAADGAGFSPPEPDNRPVWQRELDELTQDAPTKITVVELSGLELSRLQAKLLPIMVSKLQGRELALARRAPIFRNTVASHLIQATARSNAQLVLIANLTSAIPLIGEIISGGADFVILTKNQFEMSHRLAGVYGQKRDSRVEVYLEIAPILGMAFLWKGLAVLAGKKLPALAGLLTKPAISYGGTMLVGRVAQYYYASGRKGPAQLAAMVRGLVEQFLNRSAKDDDSGPTPRQLRTS